MGRTPESLHVPSNKFILQPINEVSPQKQREIQRIYQEAYGGMGNWVGEDTYNRLTLPTTTDIATVEQGGKIAACVNLNNKRVGIIAVNPEFTSNGLVAEIFKGLQKARPGSWISISTDAKPMLAAATAREVPLLPVNEPAKIERLFEGTMQIKGPKEFSFEIVNDEFLKKRLARKGINQDTFTAVSKSNSLHNKAYRQIIFETPL